MQIRIILVVVLYCITRSLACPEGFDRDALSLDDIRDLKKFTIEDEVLTVRPGQQFVIKLPSNPGTGYTWLPSNETDALVTGPLPANNLVLKNCGLDPNPRNRRPLVGAGTHELWVFQAGEKETPSRMQINLMYGRSWEVEQQISTDHYFRTFFVNILNEP